METVVDNHTLTAMQQQVADTHISEDIAQYVVKLMDATRRSEAFLRGGSPRATLAVIAMSKAVAQLRGRDYVVPKDVQEVFMRTVAHRLLMSAKAEGSGITAEQVLKSVLDSVPAPKVLR